MTKCNLNALEDTLCNIITQFDVRSYKDSYVSCNLVYNKNFKRPYYYYKLR